MDNILGRGKVNKVDKVIKIRESLDVMAVSGSFVVADWQINQSINQPITLL